MTVEQEDGHTAIEQYLTEKFGEVGKKIHTGRSRNDQSLTMLRLFLLHSLAELKTLVQRVCAAYRERASRPDAAEQFMPGFTHTQKAMPTTIHLWLSSFADGLEDAVGKIDATLK